MDLQRLAIEISTKFNGVSLTRIENGLSIHASDVKGFPFTLVMENNEAVLYFGRWHEPFSDTHEALGVFEKCFSGEARLEEGTFIGIPYSGTLCIFEGDSENPSAMYTMMTILALPFLLFPKSYRWYANTFKRVSESSDLNESGSSPV